jgi:hypothetical protein
MASILRIRRRASGLAGAPASLENAELAFNEVDNILYYGKGTGGAGGTATTIEAIGGPGSMVTLTGTQTIAGDKTFSGAVNLGVNGTATTPASSDNTTKVATTAFVKAQNYVTGNQTVTLSGDVTGSGTTAITATLANTGSAGTYTKVTTDAKGRVTSGTTLAAGDIPTLTASKISDFDTRVHTSRLDQLTVPLADVSLNSRKLTNLADPIAAQDAATKAYVDAARSGLDAKESVRAATNSYVTLSGPRTIDGVAVVAGDRVLVKNQITATENGIYVAAEGAWTRATDSDTNAKVTSGMFTFVTEGTANDNSGWVLATNDPITLGTTALSFVQFSGAGSIEAGDGLTKAGNTINVVAGTGLATTADSVGLTGQSLALHNLSTNGLFARTGAGTVAARSVAGTTNRVTVSNGDGVSANPTVDIASTYVGQSSITTLGTIVTGVWNGTTIALANGGTGATTAANARTNLGLVIGTNVQAYNSNLAALAGLSGVADRLPYFTGAGTMAIATFSAFGRSLVDDADASTARATLGLGTIAVQAANNVAITGGTIDNVVHDGGTF